MARVFMKGCEAIAEAAVRGATHRLRALVKL